MKDLLDFKARIQDAIDELNSIGHNMVIEAASIREANSPFSDGDIRPALQLEAFASIIDDFTMKIEELI